MTDPRAPDMRLFARKMLLFILVQGVIWTGVVALYIRYETTNADGFGKGYLAAAIDKHNRLDKAIAGIVFVGDPIWRRPLLSGNRAILRLSYGQHGIGFKLRSGLHVTRD